VVKVEVPFYDDVAPLSLVDVVPKVLRQQLCEVGVPGVVDVDEQRWLAIADFDGDSYYVSEGEMYLLSGLWGEDLVVNVCCCSWGAAFAGPAFHQGP